MTVGNLSFIWFPSKLFIAKVDCMSIRAHFTDKRTFKRRRVSQLSDLITESRFQEPAYIQKDYFALRLLTFVLTLGKQTLSEIFSGKHMASAALPYGFR